MPKNQQVTIELEVDGKGAVRILKQTAGGLKGTGKAAKSASGAFSKLGARIISVNQAMQLASRGFRVAERALGSIISEGAEFEQRLANISTLISGDVNQSVADFSSGIRELRKVVPISGNDLGAAAYQIVSAGISDTTKALDTLEASSRLSVAGLSSVSEAADIVTSAINAFTEENLSADKAAAIFFATVKGGKTTVSELANAFGAVAPIAAQAGVSFTELNAATAALTTSGLQTSIAQQNLRQAITSLIKPTEDMQQLLKIVAERFGKTSISGTELIKVAGGVVPAFQAIRDATRGSDEQFARALGRVQGLTAALSLTGPAKDKFVTILKDMENAAGLFENGFARALDTTQNKIQIASNALSEFRQSLFDFTQPAIEAFLSVITKDFLTLGDAVKSLDPEVALRFAQSLGNGLFSVSEAAIRASQSFIGLAESFSEFLRFAERVFTIAATFPRLSNTAEDLSQTSTLAGEALRNIAIARDEFNRTLEQTLSKTSSIAAAQKAVLNQLQSLSAEGGDPRRVNEITAEIVRLQDVLKNLGGTLPQKTQEMLQDLGLVAQSANDAAQAANTLADEIDAALTDRTAAVEALKASFEQRIVAAQTELQIDNLALENAKQRKLGSDAISEAIDQVVVSKRNLLDTTRAELVAEKALLESDKARTQQQAILDTNRIQALNAQIALIDAQTSSLDVFGDRLKGIQKTTKRISIDFGQTLRDGIRESFKAVVSGTRKLSDVFDGIKEKFIGTFADAFAAIIIGKQKKLDDPLKKNISSIGDLFSALGDNITSIFGGIFAFITKGFDALTGRKITVNGKANVSASGGLISKSGQFLGSVNPTGFGAAVGGAIAGQAGAIGGAIGGALASTGIGTSIGVSLGTAAGDALLSTLGGSASLAVAGVVANFALPGLGIAIGALLQSNGTLGKRFRDAINAIPDVFVDSLKLTEFTNPVKAIKDLARLTIIPTIFPGLFRPKARPQANASAQGLVNEILGTSLSGKGLQLQGRKGKFGPGQNDVVSLGLLATSKLKQPFKNIGEFKNFSLTGGFIAEAFDGKSVEERQKLFEKGVKGLGFDMISGINTIQDEIIKVVESIRGKNINNNGGSLGRTETQSQALDRLIKGDELNPEGLLIPIQDAVNTVIDLFTQGLPDVIREGLKRRTDKILSDAQAKADKAGGDIATISGENVARLLEIQVDSFKIVSQAIADAAGVKLAGGTKADSIKAFASSLGKAVRDKVAEGINNAFFQVIDFNNLLAPLFERLDRGVTQILGSDKTGKEKANAIQSLVGDLGNDFEAISRKLQAFGPIIEQFASLQEDVAAAMTSFKDSVQNTANLITSINLSIAQFNGDTSLGSQLLIQDAKKRRASALKDVREFLPGVNIFGPARGKGKNFRKDLAGLSDLDLKKLPGRLDALRRGIIDTANAEISALQSRLELTKEWISLLPGAKTALSQVKRFGTPESAKTLFGESEARFRALVQQFNTGTAAEKIAAAKELTSLGPQLLQQAADAGISVGSQRFSELRADIEIALSKVIREASTKQAEADDIQRKIFQKQKKAVRQLTALREIAEGTKDSLQKAANATLKNIEKNTGPLGPPQAIATATEKTFARLDAGINVFDLSGKSGIDPFEALPLSNGGLVTGREVPALLHGPELVIPLDRLNNMADGIGGGVTIQANQTIQLGSNRLSSEDERILQQQFFRMLEDPRTGEVVRRHTNGKII